MSLACIYFYTNIRVCVYDEGEDYMTEEKNDIAKFEGEDFMFQLTDAEWENLRCKNFTSSWGGVRYIYHMKRD